MTLDELQKVVAEGGMPRFVASQIASWIYDKRVTDIDVMTNISQKNKQWLKEYYTVGRKKPSQATTSADGTVKYLLPSTTATAWRASTSPTATVPHSVCRRRRDAR